MKSGKKRKIRLEKIVHKNETRIKVIFDYDAKITSIVKQAKGRRWSKTLKCWHIPYKKEAFNNFLKVCKNNDIEIVYKRKKVEDKKHLSSDAEKAISDFNSYMVTKRLSRNTIKSYSGAVKKFFEYHFDKNPDEITTGDFIDFTENYIIKNKLSVSYQNQMINALKTFYKKIYNKNFNINNIERPVKRKSLPNVLSKEEVKKIISGINNIKHKTIISLIYSAGLRRSELLNLKVSDIDSERKIIKISDSKGNKDRYVNLSDKVLEMLREYYKIYRPKFWLFESPSGNKYSVSSVRNIFETAKIKAGIKKRITLHGLRHSYATHLHEKGIDIRAIQELLGHNSIKTTEIYTHISKKRINEIKSPFDDLDF